MSCLPRKACDCDDGPACTHETLLKTSRKTWSCSCTSKGMDVAITNNAANGSRDGEKLNFNEIFGNRAASNCKKRSTSNSNRKEPLGHNHSNPDEWQDGGCPNTYYKTRGTGCHAMMTTGMPWRSVCPFTGKGERHGDAWRAMGYIQMINFAYSAKRNTTYL